MLRGVVTFTFHGFLPFSPKWSPTRHRDVHEWNEDARIAHDGSAWWGADATANAYVTTKDTAIGNKEAVFWLCHKLVIVPTFMPEYPRCAVSCDKGGRETLMPDALQHGWHQAACTMFSGVTLRHDQYLEEMARTMRRDLGVLALTGQYLNKDYASIQTLDRPVHRLSWERGRLTSGS